MNKIYKVIWSKTRNCYVAVAEFVKRNGKGGSVLNRRHIAAALAMVAICAAPAGVLANSGGHLEGDDYIGDAPNYNVTINEEVNGIAYGRYETGVAESSGATLSIVTGGKANAAFGGRAADGPVTENNVFMSGGEIVRGNPIWAGNINVSGKLIGGFANAGNVEENTVELSGGTVGSWVMGGFSWNGDVANNTVTVSGGTVDGMVYGGSSDSGSATNNTVTISGGTVGSEVYGGYSFERAATNNTVILSRQGSVAPPDINGTLFGGYSEFGGTVSNNTLQVEAVGLSAPQIQNFDTYRFVLPSDIKANDTMLTLKNQSADLTIDGTKVDLAVAKGGGLNIGFGESVTLLHKTGGTGAFNVENLTGAVQTSKLDGEAGGFDVMKYTLDKPANEDKLNVAVSELFLYGDGGTNTPGQRQTGNTLTITSGKADVAFGGRAASGAVAENNVIMTGGEIVKRNAIWINEKIQVSGGLFGGLADDGNVEKNTVEISGGTVNAWAVSGFSFKGEAKENSITISGGTAKGLMYGGHSDSGNAANNTVTISGGTVESDVIGGFSSDGDATNNTVTISGGEVKGAVYVGDSRYDATNNTVIISGGTVGSKVYGGWGDRFVTGNTVILSKEKEKPAPVLNGTLFGGNGHGTISNNTLQVEAVSLSAPQIRNFDTYRFVLPSDIKAGDTMLTLTNQNDDDVTIDPNRVSFTTDSSFGLNLDESITLLHKTGGSKTLNLNGYGEAYERLDGVPDGQPVKEFWLYTSDEKDKLNARYDAKNLYGEGGDNRKGERVKGNTLTIGAGEIASNAYGGRVDSGDVTENEVKMSGGKIVIVYGGYSEKGSATGNTVTISGGTVEGTVYGGYSDAGVFDTAIPTATGNTVNISGGTVKGSVYGSYLKGSAENNTVDISGGTVEGYVFGGYSWDDQAVERNTVIIRGGIVEGVVIGGLSTNYNGFLTGNAKNNKVILSKMSGKEAPILRGDLWGSYFFRGSDNTLQVEAVGLSAPQIQNFDTYRFVLPSDIKAGDTMLTLTNQNYDDVPIDSSRVSFTTGSSFGLNLGDGITLLHKTGGSKTLNLNGNGSSYERLDGEADGLPVKEFKLNVSQENDKVDAEYAARYLYGEGGTNKKGQRESGNTLEIKGGKATAAFGGRATTNDVTGNKVEMSGGELVLLSDSSDPDYGISGSLYGGYTDAGNVQGNTVEMSGGRQEIGLYGGYTKSGMAGGDKPEHGNKVSMTGGEANNITGGSTDDGAAGYNTVSVSNAKVAHATGGATLEGDAVGNTVTLTNTELSCTVTGGDVYRGRAAENTVTIDGGSVGMDVFGGVSISGNVENNTVSIRGGKINGVLDGLKTGLTGGYGSERVVGNTVAITGGELFVESVYGGYHTSRSGSGLAEKNVVTLGGGSYDAGLNVIGGGSDNEANDNAVNLTGTTQGLDGAKLYGWKETRDGATVTGTGNELHVGGAKTYDKNGAATIAKGSWRGMDANGKHTNRVDTVANFDSIALHNVVWGDVPAISANEITNIGGLDVTGLEFFTRPDNSTVHEHAYKDYMVLVHSDGSELTGLSISYLDEGTVKKEPLTNEGIYYHDTTHHSTENGVTVDGIEKKRIYLADHNKSVDFCFHVDGDKITLGDVAFVKGGTARTLDGRFDVRNADIDAGGLKMTGASMKGVEAGDFMTVVDAEDAIKNAKGETLKAFADQIYDVAFSDDVTANLNLSGIHTDTLSQNAEKTKLTYTVGEKNVSEATMTGELAWKDGGVHYTNTVYNFNADAKTDLGGLTFGKVTTDPTGQSMTLIGGKAAGTVENAPASFGVSLAKANTTLDATAAGSAAVANGDVTYSVNSVTLDKVTVNQITAAADAVPDTWTVAKDASGKTALTIDTENMQLPTGSANKEHAILTISNDSFAGATVTGRYAYAIHSPFTKANGGVSLAGEKEGGVKLSNDSKSVVYHVVQDHVKDITLGSVSFAKDATLLPVGNEYEFTKVNAVNVQNFAVNYAAPQNVAVNDSMTLLQANNTLQANALLANMAADVKSQTQPYRFAPVDGVTVAAKITGSLGTTAKGDGFTYTVNSNQADSLTFGSVDWKDGGVLLTRPANITFEGAEVDTSKIHFKNVHGLDANKQMTLVSDFGNNAGKITGSKYYIGATLEGEGSATLNGSDLIFTTKTGTNPNPGPTPDPTPLHAQEQTHNTVMGQTAGVSLLASGAEQISQALNSLSLLDSFGGMTGTGGGTGSTTGTGTTVQTGGEGGSSGQSGSGGSENSGQGQEGSGGSETGNEKGQSKESDDRNGSGNSDQQESNAEANGIIIASVGGGHMHQETGSHVTSNSWNGVLGIGGKRAGKNGTLQYLAFAEHGRANFTLHSDAGRGDGTSKYVGGGLIGKWQNRRDVYVEASIRAGRMHDTASDMLYDEATGRSYGYDVHANYIGGHVGLGKVFYYDNGRNLDVYARYFHMKRDGVSFDAGGHFDLDSVTSSVLRVGARYGATNKKWNWYGGLAYEYEFDGKSTGRADGAPIRAASMEGGSVRAEIGLRMEASKTSPWKADINLSGYAGKRRGISGNVAVAYTF